MFHLSVFKSRNTRAAYSLATAILFISQNTSHAQQGWELTNKERNAPILNGSEIENWPSGKLKAKREFVDGRLVNSVEYNEEGILIYKMEDGGPKANLDEDQKRNRHTLKIMQESMLSRALKSQLDFIPNIRIQIRVEFDTDEPSLLKRANASIVVPYDYVEKVAMKRHDERVDFETIESEQKRIKNQVEEITKPLLPSLPKDEDEYGQISVVFTNGIIGDKNKVYDLPDKAAKRNLNWRCIHEISSLNPIGWVSIANLTPGNNPPILLPNDQRPRSHIRILGVTDDECTYQVEGPDAEYPGKVFTLKAGALSIQTHAGQRVDLRILQGGKGKQPLLIIRHIPKGNISPQDNWILAYQLLKNPNLRAPKPIISSAKANSELLSVVKNQSFESQRFGLPHRSIYLNELRSMKSYRRAPGDVPSEFEHRLGKHIDQRSGHALQKKSPLKFVMGRIIVDEGDDPTMVLSQMRILEGGYFIDLIRDLNAPIGFRMHGYDSGDLTLEGKSGLVIDVGDVRLNKTKEVFKQSITGKVLLEDQQDETPIKITLKAAHGPLNNHTYGYEGHNNYPKLIKVPVDSNGNFSAEGLSPIEYFIYFNAENYKREFRKVDLSHSDENGKLGTITLK